MPKPCRRFVSGSVNQTGADTYECIVQRNCSDKDCSRRGKGPGIRVPGETRMIISDTTKAGAEGATKYIRDKVDNKLGKECDKERK